jgi:hypothetical protein
MQRCFECNEPLEVKRFGSSRVGFSEGLPAASPITHARCMNSAADCVVSRAWLVVNEVDNRLLLVWDGKTMVGQ